MFSSDSGQKTDQPWVTWRLWMGHKVAAELKLIFISNSCLTTLFCSLRTLMASTHVNHNIYITEVKTGKCLHSLVGHRRTPWCVTFHPTIPGLVASGCLDGEVRIWDLHVSAPLWSVETQLLRTDFSVKGETSCVRQINWKKYLFMPRGHKDINAVYLFSRQSIYKGRAWHLPENYI